MPLNPEQQVASTVLMHLLLQGIDQAALLVAGLSIVFIRLLILPA